MKKVSEILTSKSYLQGRFFGDGVERKNFTDQCAHKNQIYTLKIIPTNRPENSRYPKFIPQIKQSCQNCSKYLKFAPQTPALINKFNKKLQEVVING